MAGKPPLFAVIPMNTESAIGVLAITSVLFLLLVFLILYVARTVEFKLIALGLLTGVLAVWVSQIEGPGGVSVQARTGQPVAVSASAGGSDAAAALGRVAVLLVLGGVGSLFWNRWASPAVPARPEEAIRADRP